MSLPRGIDGTARSKVFRRTIYASLFLSQQRQQPIINHPSVDNHLFESPVSSSPSFSIYIYIYYTHATSACHPPPPTLLFFSTTSTTPETIGSIAQDLSLSPFLLVLLLSCAISNVPFLPLHPPLPTAAAAFILMAYDMKFLVVFLSSLFLKKKKIIIFAS